MKQYTLFILSACVFLLYSCGEEPQPKPYAYFRITLPPVEYNTVDTLGPYRADVSVNCISNSANSHYSTPNDKWINLFYPTLNATIHLSYKHISPSDLNVVTEESRTLVYKHTILADAIRESYYENPERHVYCMFYELTGNAASPTQFYATDSISNFLRGSVYFNNIPNYDSVMPCAKYIENDLVHFVESLEWKN